MISTSTFLQLGYNSPCNVLTVVIHAAMSKSVLTSQKFEIGQVPALRAHCVCTAWALRVHCVHTAHAKAGILAQEYLSPDWLQSKATKPT